MPCKVSAAPYCSGCASPGCAFDLKARIATLGAAFATLLDAYESDTAQLDDYWREKYRCAETAKRARAALAAPQEPQG